MSQFKILFLQNEQYDPDKLKKDDRRKVENTMVGLIIMNWMRGQLPDLIAKYGKSYFLIQQDFNKPGNIRINYLKTDFLT